MVGEIRPTEPPELSRAADGDPFGALPAHTQIGKYEVIATLGQGGFGITYRARDTQLDREVAIKEYLPTAFARRLGGSTVVPRSTQTAEDFLWGRARFLDEARTLAKLEDAPGIVNVYDFMEANGTAYMVMALVRGETLDARLKRDRRLPQPAIELLLYPLLDGLEIVHAAGFLHRDIKPANILTDSNGRPTLIDFGASRLALQGRTQAMTAIYTPGYAAPEQMTPSAKQGPWTDVYALAGTLYHCVAGTPPISAIERLTGDAMVPAVEVGKGRYGPSLLAAIDAGLTLKAADRPQSVAEWRQVLSGIAADRPQGTPTRELDDPTRPMTDELTRQVARPPRRAPWAWVAAIIVVLAAGGGAWMTLRPAPETPAEALRRVEEEARQQTALAAKLRQEEEARQRLAADAARKAEAEAARRAAEEKAAAEAAARRQNEEAERQRAAAEAARRKADEEAARRAAEERAAAEAVARRKAEEEAAARAEAEAARRRAEEQARAEAEARRKAEAEAAARKAAEEKAAAEAAAKRKSEEEARARAEAEAARRAEDERRAAEARARAEAAAREKAEAEAARRVEEDARRRAEEAARKAAEDKARAEADAKRQAEIAEAALHLSEPDRKRIQVALTALGFDTRGSDGAFGPRTRAMIAAWQAKQGAAETGYMTALQLAALRQQAAPALAKYDEDQKKAEDDKRKAEEEAKRKQEEDAKRKAEEPQQQAATSPAPPPGGGGVDGVYVGEFCQGRQMSCVSASLTVRGSAAQLDWSISRCRGRGSMSVRIDASGAIAGSTSGYQGDCTPVVGRVWGRLSGTTLSIEGTWGGGDSIRATFNKGGAPLPAPQEPPRESPPGPPSAAATPSTGAKGPDGRWTGGLNCENGPTPTLSMSVTDGSGKTSFMTRYGPGGVSVRISGDTASGEISFTGREGGTWSGPLGGTVKDQLLTASANTRGSGFSTPILCRLRLVRQ